MKKTAREKQAFGFLCIVLAAVVVFVAGVCVLINKRNNDILAKTSSPTGAAGVSNVSGSAVSTTAAASKKPASSETSKTAETTTPETESSTAADTTKESADSSTEKVTAAAAGSIKNPKIITIDKNKWYLTLVNSGYRIPDSYSPDLTYVCSSGERLDSKVAEHYEEMFNAAEKEGIHLTPCSGYRSYETQERNYNNKTSYYEGLGYSHDEACVKAATIIMPPGSSEHNLGYAMDIVCVDEWFEDTDEYTWLTENAADYGFILRYPKDKVDVTKVIYEPWHWRYVGVDAAKEMKASGQVLEEYLGVN